MTKFSVPSAGKLAAQLRLQSLAWPCGHSFAGITGNLIQNYCRSNRQRQTRILHAIGELGEQILDLEGLSKPQGSVLGVQPNQPQLAQNGLKLAS